MIKSVRKNLIAVAALIGIAVIICTAIFVTAAYPDKYKDTIARLSAKYGVEHNLVLGVIKAESGFDEAAKSKAGAVGLMQIMPATGEWLAGVLELEGYTANKLTDPEVNIELGVFYLGYLMERFGIEDVALAAYNAGEGNVGTWLLNPDYSSDGKTLKDIPYTETRNYVDRVNKYRKVYNWIRR